VNTSSIVTNSIGANVVTLNSTLSVSTLTARTVNYSSIVGSSISSNTLTLSLTNASTQNTQIYQVATTNPTTSYTAIQASHVSTGTTNNALVINPSGGNVGVGTTAPYKALHVTGSSAGDVAALVANTNAGLASSASLGFGLWGTSGSGTGTTGYAAQISAVCANAANGNTDVAFNTYTGSAVAPNYTLVERMRISAAGNVGIGTTSPSANLHIVGATSIANTATLKVSNTGSGLNGTGSALVTTQIDLGAGYGPYLRAVQPNGVYTDGIRLDLCTNLGSNDGTPTPRLTILPVSGYVGIGTTAPAQLLDITNATSATPAIRLQSQYSSAYMSMGVNVGVNTYIGLQAGAATTTALGTPPFVVTSAGTIGIGTSTPGNKLDVAGGIQITTNASQPLTFLNSSGPYNWNIGGQNDGTFRVYAGAFNGVQVGWAGTSWSAISDRRLKEDIEPLDNCLSKIVSLNPVSYRMINRPSTLTKKQFGLIAQEVADIIPDIVESSWNDAAQEDRYSLLYTEIVPFLIGAIKEQNITIAAQAAANSAMQSQLASLSAWAQTMGYSASS